MTDTLLDRRVAKQRESRIRRELAKHGCVLRKSRLRGEPHIDNLGDYMVVDAHLNAVVFGSRFDYTLDDVEEWLNTPEST